MLYFEVLLIQNKNRYSVVIKSYFYICAEILINGYKWSFKVGTLNDKVFGELYNKELLWLRPYEIEIFHTLYPIELNVYTYEDDGGDITQNQRDTFINFELNKKSILDDVEKEIQKYCYEKFQITELESIKKVILKYLKIIHTEIGEDRQLGFIFDSIFDPELGIGVLVINEQVVEVGVQDIVL